MAKPRPIEGLDPDQPYASAAANVVAVRARELADHSRDVLNVTDIERVHDMRVATRRLRAALEVFEPCFPAAGYKKALAEVKSIADALGERRDADIAIATLESFAAGLANPDRPGVASLVEQIRAEQADANASLEAFVQPQRLAALTERLSELVVEAEAVSSGRRGGSRSSAPPGHWRRTRRESCGCGWMSSGPLRPRRSSPAGSSSSTTCASRPSACAMCWRPPSFASAAPDRPRDDALATSRRFLASFTTATSCCRELNGTCRSFATRTPRRFASAQQFAWKSGAIFYGDNTEFFNPYRTGQTILGAQLQTYL